MSETQTTTIICPGCGHRNVFSQPYPYHAGFSDQGFLYNDQGNLTLVWSSYDPAFQTLVGEKSPWDLSENDRNHLEASLVPAPSGGLFRFANPARCVNCKAPIQDSILKTVYYLVYPNSLIIEGHANQGDGLVRYLKKEYK